ncbi:MAG TPA: SRPBCC domain-containing protein [Actinomycetota bacterium]|nr:SRPBCC domain-containing protein [Actinomycetota bacterium]
MEPIPNDSRIVRIERHLPAPPEIVFGRWTDPSSMARWLSPTGEAEVEADVCVGGRFTVVMLGEGMRLQHTGEYLEIEPPLRLSFTWISPFTGEEPSVVIVELEPSGHGTVLRLTHERLPLDQVEPHRRGWTAIVKHFTAALASEGGRTVHP